MRTDTAPLGWGWKARAGAGLIGLLLAVSSTTPALRAQAGSVGQWATLPYVMPINPVHSALLPNGKILIVAGSGNCPPSQSGCPSGPPYGPSNASGAVLYDPAAKTFTQFTLSWDMLELEQAKMRGRIGDARTEIAARLEKLRYRQ